MSVLTVAAGRVLRLAVLLALVFAAGSAAAQGAPPWGRNQSPVDITPPRESAVPVFTDTAGLEVTTAFTLKNTTGTNWCKRPGPDTCEGTVDQRWASLKAYAPEKPTPIGEAPQITFGGARYTLKEFHFHYPAEHLIKGQLDRMEIHFVFHKNGAAGCTAGEYLVVGQLIEQGSANEELEKIFGPGVPLPGPGQSYGPVSITVSNILRGFPATTSSYRYAGSLTAPAEIENCIPPSGPRNPNQLGIGLLPEVVSWVLLTHPLTLSHEQIERFEALFPEGNSRAPQDLYQDVKMGPDARRPAI
jgi:carbonic anhydrase